MKDPSATNRISQYDATGWLALLIRNRLIEYGEPVIAAHESMMAESEICRFDDDNDEDFDHF